MLSSEREQGRALMGAAFCLLFADLMTLVTGKRAYKKSAPSRLSETERGTRLCRPI